jgi:S1-C subfamily serine protease
METQVLAAAVLALAAVASPLQRAARAAGPVWESGGTRCMPNFRSGKPVGYLCVKVEPGSAYARSGLRAGDNVSEIDGKPLTGDFEKSLELWAWFEKADSVSLVVERGGERLELRKQRAGGSKPPARP